MRMPENIMDKETLLSVVHKNSEKPEFRYFLESCIRKWEQVRPEMELIDCLMDSICRTWNISRAELLSERKYFEARSLFFYLIHKKVNLSYEIIGDMFGRVKGNVHSGAKIIETRLKKKRQTVVDGYEAAENDIISFLSS